MQIRILIWVQEIAASQGVSVGKKSYEEFTRNRWSSGAPSVTSEGGLCKEGEMQTSKSVLKEGKKKRQRKGRRERERKEKVKEKKTYRELKL